MDGVALAHVAKCCDPTLEIIVTSGSPAPAPLPEGAAFWSKPWAPLDVIRMAERKSLALRAAQQARSHKPS